MTYTPELLSSPLPCANAINRKNIMSRIGTLSKHGILFISAPAGYGKTTAAAMWSRGKDSAWLTLDEYFDHSTDIYRWLLSVLSLKIPDSFDTAPLKTALGAMRSLDKCPEAIIIDDFHLCNDPAVSQGLIAIRARIPASAAFIIISRNPPPVEMEEQILKGRIKLFTELQFTADEIIMLYKGKGETISKHSAELLCQKTDGWAAALSAVLISGNEGFSKIHGNEALNNYLRSCLFTPSESFSVLKMCSVCDILKPGLCVTVSENQDAWEVITVLARRTGLVLRYNNNSYRFHSLLKEFLFSELSQDKSIDKSRLYKNAADWYKDNGDLLRAVTYAAKSGDLSLAENFLRLKSEKYGRYRADVAGYVSIVFENLYSKIPSMLAKQSLRLSMEYFYTLFYLGRLNESLEWLDTSKMLLEAGNHRRADIIGAALHMCLDPREKVLDIPQSFKKIAPILQAAKDSGSEVTSSITLTLNMPFFHKAQVDYSDISPNLDEFLAKAGIYMKPILGSAYKPLIMLLEAGLRYERGELEEAGNLAGEVCRIAEAFPTEIQFSAYALHTEVLRVRGETFDTSSIVGIAEKAGADYLSDNLNAFLTNTMLQDGDISAADAWSLQAETDKNLKLYKLYQYFTDARALMVSGRFAEAEQLLERLADFSQSYRRSTNYIEALVLISICKWRMNRTDEAVKTFVTAIIKAYELQIIMPIVKEGRDILPVVQKILNRLKYGYDAEILDKSFVNTLFFEAHSISQIVRGMFSESSAMTVKLSARQTEILGYLSHNYSYREISEVLGVKITTVDDHIFKLYRKLGVTNAYDAVIAAKRSGIKYSVNTVR